MVLFFKFAIAITAVLLVLLYSSIAHNPIDFDALPLCEPIGYEVITTQPTTNEPPPTRRFRRNGNNEEILGPIISEDYPAPGTCWCGPAGNGTNKWKMYNPPGCVCGTTSDKRPRHDDFVKTCICSDIGGYPRCVCYEDEIKYKATNDVCFAICPDKVEALSDYTTCICEDGWGAECAMDELASMISPNKIFVLVLCIAANMARCLLRV